MPTALGIGVACRVRTYFRVADDGKERARTRSDRTGGRHRVFVQRSGRPWRAGGETQKRRIREIETRRKLIFLCRRDDAYLHYSRTGTHARARVSRDMCQGDREPTSLNDAILHLYSRRHSCGDVKHNTYILLQVIATDAPLQAPDRRIFFHPLRAKEIARCPTVIGTTY